MLINLNLFLFFFFFCRVSDFHLFTDIELGTRANRSNLRCHETPFSSYLSDRFYRNWVFLYDQITCDKLLCSLHYDSFE